MKATGKKEGNDRDFVEKMVLIDFIKSKTLFQYGERDPDNFCGFWPSVNLAKTLLYYSRSSLHGYKA